MRQGGLFSPSPANTVARRIKLFDMEDLMNSWILVSDASRARVFEVNHGRQPLRLVRELSHPKSRLKAHDLVTDNRGRMNNGIGRQKRSVMEPRTPVKQTEQQV